MCAEYNILFLGETQSGKSTLIESLKKYAYPSYSINRDKIGNKNLLMYQHCRIILDRNQLAIVLCQLKKVQKKNQSWQFYLNGLGRLQR